MMQYKPVLMRLPTVRMVIEHPNNSRFCSLIGRYAYNNASAIDEIEGLTLPQAGFFQQFIFRELHRIILDTLPPWELLDFAKDVAVAYSQPSLAERRDAQLPKLFYEYANAGIAFFGTRGLQSNMGTELASALKYRVLALQAKNWGQFLAGKITEPALRLLFLEKCNVEIRAFNVDSSGGFYTTKEGSTITFGSPEVEFARYNLLLYDYLTGITRRLVLGMGNFSWFSQE